MFLDLLSSTHNIVIELLADAPQYTLAHCGTIRLLHCENRPDCS